MRYSVALGRCVRNSGEDATPTVCKYYWLLVQSYPSAELSYRTFRHNHFRAPSAIACQACEQGRIGCALAIPSMVP